ncbi:MAG: TrpB-like pyridoxal-phosphate dependent enzyme, partial [Promethearchaeota archaeon]
APEAAHAVKEAINQALTAKDNNEKKNIVFCLSGHGFFDLLAYKEYLVGNLVDYELPNEEIQKALTASDMPSIDETRF